MKKLIMFIIMCFMIAACGQEKEHNPSASQLMNQDQKLTYTEDIAKQRLADYLDIEDTTEMKIVHQDLSSYVIQTNDTTYEENDRTYINEHTYTVSQDGTIFEHTTPEKLIGTWSNQDHTIVYTMTDKTITIRDTLDQSNNFFNTTNFYIPVNENRSDINQNNVTKFYTVIWDLDEYLERNPSLKNMNPQPFIFIYNTSTDTFSIGENVFTREDTKKVQDL